MKSVKVAVVQKSFGTAELIVGSESMLVNCPILYKWLCTKTEFTFPNAFLKECQIKVERDTCRLRMEDMEAVVDKKHFMNVIHRFCFDLVDKSEAHVDVKLATDGGKEVRLPVTNTTQEVQQEVHLGMGGGMFDYDY